MKTATDNLIKTISYVDLIIEVLDARCIHSSSNIDLTKIIKNKQIIKVALKEDLSDLKKSDDILFISTKDNRYKKILIDKLYSVMEDKINKQKLRGLVNPHFNIMVVGLPNVGKSSLINFLSTKRVLIAENRAGLTRTQATRKINDNFSLIDNPGIFCKNVLDVDIGYKLALINSINKNILPLHEINEYFHNFMVKKYWKKYSEYFNIYDQVSYSKFLELISIKMNYFCKNKELDLNKAEDYLFNLYSNAKICRYHFED